MRKAIRGGMGLGDALYVQSVARHLVASGVPLRVHTAWPDVFRPLAPLAQTAPFKRTGIDYLAHYPSRKHILETTQFEDCCLTAGIREPVELRLDWKPTNQPLIDSLLRHGKPIVCVQLPRSPMGRVDGFGKELLPDCRAIQHAIDEVAGRALVVQVGNGKPLHRFERIDVDLAGQTSVPDLLDIATIASAFIGYVSFIVPLAESLAKPALLVWSRRGLLYPCPVYVRQITPRKVLHKASSRAVMDDDPVEAIREAAHALLRPVETASVL